MRNRVTKDEVQNTLQFFADLYPEKTSILKKFITKFELNAPLNHGDKIETKELIKLINQTKTENKMKTPINENNDYNTILNGRIAVYCKEKTETSKTITSKKTAVSREYELFKDVSGFLKGIYVTEKKVGDTEIKFLIIKLYDNDTKQTHYIETMFKGAYSKNFLFRLPNVDLTKLVTLIPYNVKDLEKSKEKGKDIFNSGVSILQGTEKIKPYYTKDNPNGLPQLLEIKVKGKKSEWNDSEQMAFLEDSLKAIDLKIRSIDFDKKNEDVEDEVNADDLHF